MKRWLLVLLTAGLLAGSLPLPGAAQDAVTSRRLQAMMACADDVARYCGGVPPGRGRIIACMRFNADKLSQQCFQAITTWGLAKANAIKACLPDADRLCPHLPPRGPRARACLLQNADRLSKACGDALLVDDPFNGATKACQADLARLCPQVPPGSPAARSCILRNADKLSEPCSDALFGD